MKEDNLCNMCLRRSCIAKNEKRTMVVILCSAYITNYAGIKLKQAQLEV